MMATHSTVKLQLHTWKKKFVKYSLHGSHFVKHIFFQQPNANGLEIGATVQEILHFFDPKQKKIPSLHATCGTDGWTERH
jgi:hypothetical protein